MNFDEFMKITQYIPYIVFTILFWKQYVKKIPFIRNFMALKKLGVWKAFLRMANDKMATQAIRDLNDAADELEKKGKDYWGPDYTVPRYNLLDFFI